VSGPRLPARWEWPEQCQAGHPWGPGRVIVGWQPCQCAAALAEPGKGHQVVCCHEPGCTSAWYKPRHGPKERFLIRSSRRVAHRCPESLFTQGSCRPRHTLLNGDR
jgi:hypothetical protein